MTPLLSRGHGAGVVAAASAPLRRACRSGPLYRGRGVSGAGSGGGFHVHGVPPPAGREIVRGGTRQPGKGGEALISLVHGVMDGGCAEAPLYAREVIA